MADAASDPASQAAFLTRNAAQALPAGALEQRLREAAAEGRQLRVKLGLDPTAADIHLGHTVVLQKLREFQDLGHRVVLIVGDYTARVGDPSGRSDTRPVLSDEEIEANARTYERQAQKVLDDDPDRYELRFNGEWLDMRMHELFRAGPHDDRRPAARPRGLRDALRGRRADLDPRAAVPADAGLRLGRRALGRRARRDRPDLQPAARARHPAPLRPARAVRADAADPPGHRRRRQDVEDQGQPDRHHRAAGGDVRQDDAAPRRGDGRVVRAACGRARPTGASPRDAKRALARAIIARFHDADAARGRRAALRPRPRRAPGAGRDRRRRR